MRITIETDDLDRLTLALLFAKIDYLTEKSCAGLSHREHEYRMRNYDLLDSLYKQLNAALALVEA